MRAYEFVAEGREEFNWELMQPGFEFEQEIAGVTYKVANDSGQLMVTAWDPKGKQIGHAVFWKHQTRSGLESLSTEVDPAWQGKGIAANMYAVVRMLGANINPSLFQTRQGKHMWNKWRQQGDVAQLKNMNAKIKEQGVVEGIEHYDGIEISMEKEADEIMVKAMMSGGRELGHVLFVIDGEYLAPQDLEVDDRYQGQGIAATMYDYVKSKGYKIRRSGQQTDAGAGFWDKHKPGKNVWEQGVAENFADGKVKGKSRPGRVKRAGASCSGSVTDLRQKAKNASGEKAKMYHWCANMKSGRKK